MALSEAQKKDRSEYLEKNLQITECSQRKPFVFISYASDNWERVFKEAVVPMQKQYGLQVYADKAFDKVNDKWIVPMLRNIRGSDVVVAFVSQSYIESYACFLELLTAVNNRKPIVFVSLEEGLRLGDTTDLPIVERGAKNEILNQGANISTNTNNTSNDIMRAMKSAYTSISTLLGQDALSKYDISDAFINFFRNASINRKTINDLQAVRSTINSVSKQVFDKSLVAGQPKDAPAQPPAQRIPPPVQEGPVYQPPVQTGPAYQEPGQQPQGEAEFTWEHGKKGGRKPKRKLLTGMAAAVFVAVVMTAVLLLGGSKSVKNEPFTLLDGSTGTYTGKWENDRPADGQGSFTWENGDTYEGEFREGNPNGEGTCTYASGQVYVGEWKDGVREGRSRCTEPDGGYYDGGWKDNKYDGQGTQYYGGDENDPEADFYVGEFADGFRNGYGVYTWADGERYEGNYVNGWRHGHGKVIYANADESECIMREGEWTQGERDGIQTLTWANGAVLYEEYDNGTLIETRDQDGNLVES